MKAFALEDGLSNANILQISLDMRQAKRDNLRSRAPRSPSSMRDSLLPCFCLTQLQTDLQYTAVEHAHAGGAHVP